MYHLAPLATIQLAYLILIYGHFMDLAARSFTLQTYHCLELVEDSLESHLVKAFKWQRKLLALNSCSFLTVHVSHKMYSRDPY